MSTNIKTTVTIAEETTVDTVGDIDGTVDSDNDCHCQLLDPVKVLAEIYSLVLDNYTKNLYTHTAYYIPTISKALKRARLITGTDKVSCLDRPVEKRHFASGVFRGGYQTMLELYTSERELFKSYGEKLDETLHVLYEDTILKFKRINRVRVEKLRIHPVVLSVNGFPEFEESGDYDL